MKIEKLKQKLKRNNSTHDVKRNVYNYFLPNPNMSLDEMKKTLGIYPSQISKIITEFIITERRKHNISFFSKTNDVSEDELLNPCFLNAKYEELISEIPKERKLTPLEFLLSKKRKIINNSLRKIELENLIKMIENGKANDPIRINS